MGVHHTAVITLEEEEKTMATGIFGCTMIVMHDIYLWSKYMIVHVLLI